MRVKALQWILVALSLSACSLVDRIDPAKHEKVVHGLSESELRGRLAQFSRSFTSVVSSAADEMSRRTDDPVERRRILRWKMNLVTECRNAALGRQPKPAFLDTWAYCVQLRIFFESEAGKKSAGDDGEIALRAALEAEEQIEEIAADLLGHGFDDAEEDVNDFARNHPMTSQSGRRSFERVSEAEGGAAAQLAWVLNIPLAPFRGLNLGIDEVAVAVGDFSVVADRFSTMIENLPQDIRWQTQLALYDVEDRPTTLALLDDLEHVSVASKTIAASIERLPDDIRGAIEDGFHAAEASQPELRETLATADLAIRNAGESAETLRALVQDTRVLLTDLGGASADIARAGTAWEGVLNAYGELASDSSAEADSTADDGDAGSRSETPDSRTGKAGAAPGEGDDDASSDGIEAYGSAADQIATAAEELRALIGELGVFLQAKEWNSALEDTSRTTQASVTHAAQEGRDLVDHAALRIAQLLALLGGILLATRWLSPRRATSRRAGRAPPASPTPETDAP